MKPGKQIKIKQKQTNTWTKPEYFIFLFVHQVKKKNQLIPQTFLEALYTTQRALFFSGINLLYRAAQWYSAELQT